MKVKELIEALQRHLKDNDDHDGEVTVECEHQGDGLFNHVIFVDGDIVESWDVEDE